LVWSQLGRNNAAIGDAVEVAVYSIDATPELTFSASSLDWEGTWNFKVQGQVGEYGTVLSNEITVTVVNPCRSTVINNGDVAVNVQTIIDMSTTVKLGTFETQQFDYYIDSASDTYGNGLDKCGARSYEISGVPDVSNVLTLEENATDNKWDLKLKSDLNSDIDTYTVTLTVKLVDYFASDNRVYTQEFTVVIAACDIITVGSNNAGNIEYLIGQPVDTVSFTQYTQIPQCGYTPTYTSECNSGNLPAGITFDAPNR